MYQVLFYTEFVMSIVLLAISLIMFRYKLSRPIQYIQYAFFCMFLLNIGYWLEIRSADISSAMMAVKLEYCGSVYICTLVLFVAAEYLDVNLHSVVKWILFAIDTGILLLVLTCEENGLFFSDIKYVNSGIYPHLVLEPGFFRYVFAVYIMLTNLFMLALLTYYYVRGMRNGRKIPALLLFFLYLPAVAIMLHLTGIMKVVDLSPIFIGLAGVGVFVLLKNDMMFQIMDAATEGLLDNIQDAFIVMDSKMKLLNTNSSARILFPELDGDGDEAVIVYEQSEILRNIIDEKPGDIISIGERYYLVRFSSILNNNKLEGYYMHFSDRTEWKHYTDDLIQRSISVEEESEAKNAMLVNTSHDIRTPISAVIGLNELIMRKTDDPEILEFSTDIERSGKYLLSLVNNLLDVSKIEAGKMHIIEVDYDMRDLLDEIAGLARINVRDKKLGFNINVDGNIPSVLHGDEVRIKQILNNLVSNAVKYTEKGHIDMDVSLVKKDELYVLLRFEVKDTGIGIKPEDMSKITQAFERVDEINNYKVEGTGLGMSIIINLLKMMNSRLDIKSSYSEGSSFSFTLRQGVAGDAVIGDYNRKDTADKHAAGKNLKSSFTAPDARVLVVDDNRINIVLLKNLLKQNDISIDAASSGETCIDAVRNKAYHIILLDYMMPGMNGIETLNMLKTMDDNMSADAYVAALTADVVSGVDGMYKTAGFDDYLAKPIDYGKLENMLLRALPDELVIMN